MPEDCTSKLASEGAHDAAVAYYNAPENNVLIQAASTTIRASIDNHWPRVREIVHFAREIGAKRIGIASCISFAPEAELLAQILRDEGFEAIDAMCRIGSISRMEAGLCDASDERAKAVACNPYMQADVLNQVGTDFNVIVGLCLGHDMLFARRSEAWVTTLAVKDQSRTHAEILGDALKAYRASMV